MAPPAKDWMLKQNDPKVLHENIRKYWDMITKLAPMLDDEREENAKHLDTIAKLEEELAKLKAVAVTGTGCDPKKLTCCQIHGLNCCDSCCCMKLKECKKELKCCKEELKCCKQELKCCKQELKCCKEELKCCKKKPPRVVEKWIVKLVPQVVIQYVCQPCIQTYYTCYNSCYNYCMRYRRRC